MQDFDEFLGRDLRLFGVDEEFIDKLKWMDRFVAEEVEPLDTLGFSPYDTTHPARAALFPPLQKIVQQQGLWACHLGPELGGPGFGQFKLALMNIILGRSRMASKIFGTVRARARAHVFARTHAHIPTFTIATPPPPRPPQTLATQRSWRTLARRSRSACISPT